MSAESSTTPTNPTRPTISSTPTATESPINLVDHTRTSTEENGVQRAETIDQQLDKSLTGTISRNLTHASLRPSQRHRYQRQRWQEGRTSRNSNLLSDETTASAITDGQNSTAAPTEQDDDTWGQGAVQRTFSKHVKGLVRKPSKKKKHVNDENSQIDILYENQRGFFLFGIPRFSSNSLLNFDPSSWIDSDFKPSAVNITNAQVPDPSWEWAWRAWYVDMSRDVDEEGWEYSFWFGNSCAWHGTHPWFHSFVRRRRWLRRRVKRHTHHRKDTLAEGHALNSDYFTIHSEPRPRSIDESSVATSQIQSPNKIDGARSPEEAHDNQHDGEVRDIPTLMSCLKRAAIDREKIVLIGKFLEQGGDELYYLSEHMSDIMSLLVFQGSRQQLLSILITKIDAAKAHRDEHKARNEPEDKTEGRYIDNMLKAFEAADDHSKRLEYWSDLREMSRKGEISGAAAQGWGHGWQNAGNGGQKSNALASEHGQACQRSSRAADEVDRSQDENVPEELAQEDRDDGQLEAAKQEAESRQLAEVEELKDGANEDGVKSPAKLTSFPNEEQDDDSEHEMHHNTT